MAEIVTYPYSRIRAAMRQVESAGLAVRQGIATHAEKHRVERERSRQALAATAGLAQGVTGSATAVRPVHGQ